MRHRSTAVSNHLPLLSLLLLLLLPATPAQSQIAQPAYAAGGEGLSFEENHGQIADHNGTVRPDILYVALSRDMNIYLGRSAVSYVFNRYEGDWKAWHRADGHTDADFHREFMQQNGREFLEPRLAQYRVDLELIGASPNVQVESSSEVDGLGYRNYYLPHCPDGVLGVRSYKVVTYRQIYRNIDMVLRSTDSGLKCDFVVRPGGNPADIRMRYRGADDVTIDAEGGTAATTPFGTLGETAPVSYTTDGAGGVLSNYNNGVHLPVESRFTLADGVLSFDLGIYDSRRTLVIDPYRLWSTYYGGTGQETVLGGHSAEMDRRGNLHFCGSTTNTAAFPVSAGTTQYTGGGTDAMLVKLRENGTRAWAIIYGGSGGFLGDLAHGITSDTLSNVYISGHTDATNFPVTTGTEQTTYGGGGRDAFVIKFDSGGVRQWATFYGGAQADDGYGFGLDSAGNPVLGAASASTGLQTATLTASSGGTADALIAKFDRSTGERIWATYFGGSGNDQAFAIAGDINNNVVCVGWTNSNGLATGGVTQSSPGGSYDGFAVKYNSNGVRLWSSYIGGSGRENESGAGGFGGGYAVVATDPVGNVYVAGSTNSADFPTSRPYQGAFGGGTTDAYLVKLDTNGKRLWSTFLGGTTEEGAQGVAVNNEGDILLTGYCTAALPARLITGDALQETYRGGTRDAFILKLDSSGQSVLFGTMYGGTASDEGAGIGVDPFGSIVVVGETSSNNFPVGTGPLPPGSPALPGGVPFQTTISTAPDVWVALICDIERDAIRHTNGTRIGDTLYLCRDDSTELYVGEGYARYQWLTTPDTTARIHPQPGVSAYALILTSNAGCIAQSDTLHIHRLSPPAPRFSGDSVFASGDSTEITLIYGSDPGPGLVTYTIYDSTLTTVRTDIFQNRTTRTQVFTTPDAFRVIVTTGVGCRDTSPVYRVTVEPPSDVDRGGDAGRTAILLVTPHPVTNSAIVTFSTAESGPVTLELTTINGERVTTLLNEGLPAGRHTAHIPAGIASGSYLLIVTTSTGRAVRRVEFVR